LPGLPDESIDAALNHLGFLRQGEPGRRLMGVPVVTDFVTGCCDCLRPGGMSICGVTGDEESRWQLVFVQQRKYSPDALVGTVCAA